MGARPRVGSGSGSCSDRAHALFPGAGPARARQSSPLLPQRERFIAEGRAHLRTDADLQSQYTYLERRQDIRVSKLGKVRLGDVRLFEVYPSPEPGQTERERTEAGARQKQQNIIDDMFRVRMHDHRRNQCSTWTRFSGVDTGVTKGPLATA